MSKRRKSKELGSTLARMIIDSPSEERRLWINPNDEETGTRKCGEIFHAVQTRHWRVYLHCLIFYFCAGSFELLILESINLKTLDTSKKFSPKSSFSGLAGLIQAKAILFCTNYSLSLNHWLITSIWNRIFQCSCRSQ